MADEKNDAKAAPTEPWYASHAKKFGDWVGKQAGLLSVLGALGYITYVGTKDAEAKDALLSMTKVTDKTVEWMVTKFEIIYARLRFGLMMAAVATGGMLLSILYSSLYFEQLAYHVPGFRPSLWEMLTNSRGSVMLFGVLVFFLLVLQFVTKILVPLGALDIVNGRLNHSLYRDGLLERVLRGFGKLKAWVAFSIVPALAAPFWRHPELLHLAIPAILIYPFFCNSWKRGESEHLRRIVLWLTAFWHGDMILLATFPRVYDELVKINTAPSTWSWVILSLFVVQLVMSIVMGARKTREDHGRESVLPEVAAVHQLRASGVTPAELAEISPFVRRNMPAEVAGNSVQQISGQPAVAATAALLRSYPQPRSKTAEHIIILALVIVVAWCFMIFLHVDWTKFNPMVSATWFFSSGWKVLLMIAGAWFILNYLFSRRSTNG